ncbi:MAG: hypothetical protein AVDCRST_MAG89-2561, partial [uncultured Gemmatimonadetes bacterium]
GAGGQASHQPAEADAETCLASITAERSTGPDAVTIDLHRRYVQLRDPL